MTAKKDKSTSIRIKQSTKKRIETFREHKRETHEDILERVMDVASGRLPK